MKSSVCRMCRGNTEQTDWDMIPCQIKQPAGLFIDDFCYICWCRKRYIDGIGWLKSLFNNCDRHTQYKRVLRGFVTDCSLRERRMVFAFSASVTSKQCNRIAKAFIGSFVVYRQFNIKSICIIPDQFSVLFKMAHKQLRIAGGNITNRMNPQGFQLFAH